MPNNECSSLKSECQCSEKLVVVRRDHQLANFAFQRRDAAWVRGNEYCAYCSPRRFYSRTQTSNISAR